MRWAEEDFCICDDSMTWLSSEVHLFLSNLETKPRGQAARTFCYVRPQCHIALNDLYGHQPLLLWISWWYLGKPHITLVLFKSQCRYYLHHNRTTLSSRVHLVTNRIAHRRSGNSIWIYELWDTKIWLLVIVVKKGKKLLKPW